MKKQKNKKQFLFILHKVNIKFTQDDLYNKGKICLFYDCLSSVKKTLTSSLQHFSQMSSMSAKDISYYIAQSLVFK